MEGKAKGHQGSRIRTHGLFVALVMALLLLVPTAKSYAGSTDEEQLVEKAKHVIDSFMADPNLSWFRDNIGDSKAILIVPQLLKGAFFLGLSGGSGVLLVKDQDTGTWSGPAFYVLGSVSFGLQAGGQASEVVIITRKDGAVEKLFSSSFKLGGDASIAAGPYGAGVEGATSANLDADFLSFSRSKGAFAGISLEGAVLGTSDDSNSAYYSKDVRPIDILVKKTVKNSHSAGLIEAVAKATQ